MGQWEILEYMQNNPNKGFHAKQISELINNRQCNAATSLRKLYESGFVARDTTSRPYIYTYVPELCEVKK